MFHHIKNLLQWIKGLSSNTDKIPPINEEWFHTLALTASDAILLIDEKSTILFVNPATEEIFGYKAEEMLGQQLTMLMPEHVRQKHKDGIKQYIETEKKAFPWINVEQVGQHKNGKEIPLEISYGEFISNNRPIFTGIMRDVSKRKQLEERERIQCLEREQEAHRQAEASAQIVRQLQTISDISLFNLKLDDMLYKMVERIRDTLNVDTVAILLLTEDRKSLFVRASIGLEEEIIKKVLIPVGKGVAGCIAASGQPSVIEDISKIEVFSPILHNREVVSLLGVPLLLEGRVIGVLHVGTLKSRHFTNDEVHMLQMVADRVAIAIEHTRLYEIEHSARQTAEAISRAKDEFLATLSHELRTPLTPIVGWIHMMRSNMVPPSETEKGLAIIEASAQDLTKMIDDLLDMSAILSGKIYLEHDPVPVTDIINTAIEFVSPQASKRNVTIETSFNAETYKSYISGDRLRLIQSFWNLLSNAIKFSYEGGKIEVICNVKDGEATIQVIDHGHGIDPDFIPYVFERFRQADSSISRRFGGMGIGLSLVKTFIEIHGGRVSIASKGSGSGTTVTINLPANYVAGVDKGSGDRAIDGDSRAIKDNNGVNVLVVEDSPDTLHMLRQVFEKYGYKTIGFQSAQETLKAAEDLECDIIVSDVGLPGISGYDLLKELRKRPKFQHIPAIALTGYVRQSDIEAAHSAGFDAHIAKPTDPNELIERVETLLKERSKKSSLDS
jgi:PAS domain S-box-containing protein